MAVVGIHSKRSTALQQSSQAMSRSGAAVQLCSLGRSVSGQWRDVLVVAPDGDMTQKWHPLQTGSVLAWLDPIVSHAEACPDLMESCIMGLPCGCGDQDFVVAHANPLQTTQRLLNALPN